MYEKPAIADVYAKRERERNGDEGRKNTGERKCAIAMRRGARRDTERISVREREKEKEKRRKKRKTSSLRRVY